MLGYRYDGYWAPMDTLRDLQKLEEFVQSGHMPWAVWQKPPAEPTAEEPARKLSAVDGAAWPSGDRASHRRDRSVRGQQALGA